MLLLQIYSYIYSQRYTKLSKSRNPDSSFPALQPNPFDIQNMASSQMMMMAQTTCSKKLNSQDMIKIQENQMSYEYQKIHTPDQHFQTYMKSQAYINIRINLSTAANSIVYWHYIIINQSYAAIVDLFLYLWSKIHQTIQISKPESVIPCSPTPTF